VPVLLVLGEPVVVLLRLEGGLRLAVGEFLHPH
jgi:cytochrome c oxidase assembly factor CtaG